MPFATPLPSGILASGVKSEPPEDASTLANDGRATGKLTAGASGGALVSAFEVTTLTGKLTAGASGGALVSAFEVTTLTGKLTAGASWWRLGEWCL